MHSPRLWFDPACRSRHSGRDWVHREWQRVNSESPVAPATEPPRVASRLPLISVGVAVALIGGAFALYQPALRIGLLSDDYALLMWARRLELAPRDWGQIRPLPILAWWLLAQITAVSRTPAALHAFNVLLHGVNAFLVWALARRLTSARGSALAAGALFLAMPVSVEPVAWGSGVFDVMLTTFTLLLALVVTRRAELDAADQGLGLLLAVAMMGAKETGVVAAPLVLLLSWTRWSRLSRSAIVLATAQALLAAAYTGVRELTDRLDHRLVPRVDAAGVQRLASGLARAFVVPLHGDIIAAHPVAAVATGIFVIGTIVSWLVRCRRASASRRIAVLALAGTLVCVAPAIRLFGISPDLQGTRYVYLASAWWSIALGAALLEGWQVRRTEGVAAVAAVVAIGAAALVTRMHLQPWTAARVARDRVLLQLISVPPTCRQVAASGVPDNVAGAYVFRNGLNEALATLGRSYEWVEPERAAAECTIDAAAGPAGGK